MTAPEVIEKATPEEVFAVLSDDTRVAILQALWHRDIGAASFSELRDAVGVADSGQFNYHLDKLVGQFVAKTADGYELTQAGKRINGAIEAGAYTMAGSVDPVTLDASCPTCGGMRTLRYADDTVSVECDSCAVRQQVSVPPSSVAHHEREALPRVASQYARTTVQQLTNGFCPFCDGPVEPTVAPVSEIYPETESPESVPDVLADRVEEMPLVRFDCQQCGATPTIGLRLVLLHRPAVVSFHHDQGVDVHDRLVWDVADLNPDLQAIPCRDPFRASATYAVGGDALTVVVDDALEAVDVELS